MKTKIYYLDDEEEILEIFYDLFSNPKREITLFSDHREAIKTIESTHPHLLFIDYRLPGCTGEEIAKNLGRSFPIVLITGDINLKTDFAFEAILEKPFDKKMINQLIDKHSRI